MDSFQYDLPGVPNLETVQYPPESPIDPVPQTVIVLPGEETETETEVDFILWLRESEIRKRGPKGRRLRGLLKRTEEGMEESVSPEVILVSGSPVRVSV